jgi:cyanate permease
MVAMAAGGGVSPWLAGLVHDRTGNYDIALLMAAACMGFAALAAAWLPEFRPGEAITGKPVGVQG